MEKKIAKIGIIMVLTIALILSSFGGLPFGDTFAKQGDVDLSNDKITAQAAEVWTYPESAPTASFVGAGTVGFPYEISTAQQLADLSYFVNNGNATYGAENVFYKLTANIVLNTGTIDKPSNDAKPWKPIGESYKKPFLGAFDGQGFTVSGIYINKKEGSFQGLFGVVGSDTATIKNVGVINSYIKGDIQVSGVVGSNYGTVINCYNHGAVSGMEGFGSVGGVVGYNGGTVINCYNHGAVSGQENVGKVYPGSVINGYNVGGVVGANGGTVINCHNHGAVSGESFVGGVVGSNWGGAIINCYNTGTVDSITDSVGGVVGNSKRGAITNCYNTGAVSGRKNVGGVVGNSNRCTVIDCYNIGAVSGTKCVGGVVGCNYRVVANCYNTGAVFGRTEVGGVVGCNYRAVANCYNTGAASGTAKVGGVVGCNYRAVANCYFLKITDGINEDLNAVGANDGGAATNCSPFGVDKRLTTAGGTAADDTNKVLVTFAKAADLLATLNAGRAKYNELNPTETQATEWNKDADDYPTFQVGGVTPPTPTPNPTEPVVPENLTWLWILLAVIAVGAVVVIIVVKKKKNDDEEEKEEDVKNNKE